MKTKKTLSLVSLSILSLVLLASFASALKVDSVTITDIPTQVNHDDGSFTFNLLVNTSGTTPEDITLAVSGATGVYTLSPLTMTGVIPGENRTITATVSFEAYQSGILAGTITATATEGHNSKSFSTNISEEKSLSLESKTISESTNSTTLKLTNDGNKLLNNIQLTPSGDFTVDISGDVDSSDVVGTLNPGDVADIIITRTDDLSGVGTESVTITATASDGTTTTGKVSTEAAYCGLTPNYESLDIDINDINVKQGFGDDEDYWYPFDIVEVEIEVANDGNYDMKNLKVEWELYTDDGKKIADDEENDFKLDSDDDKTITLTIKLDDNVDDMEGVDELTLYARVKGEVDDKDSSHDGEDTCAEDKQSVDLITDDNFAVLNDIEINGMTLSDDLELTDAVACGSQLQIVADVWNIGDDDQDDVSVLITNSELGISQKVEIGDIDSFDSENLEVTLDLPKDVEAKYYILEFRIYDEDNDIFETDEDEDAALFKVLIHVDGNCQVAKTTAISADLTTKNPQAGEKLDVTATITNTGSTVKTYIVNVADYEDWATFNELDSNSLTLVGGESRDVTLNFDVKKDVSGQKQFNIEVIEGSTVTKQPVKVTIAAQKGLLANLSLPEDNLYLWIIGIVNVILILAIIFVAVRLSKD